MDKKEQKIIPVQYIPYCPEEDEIDIKEIIKTILKYKKFIVIFTFFITIAATFYTLITTPIYEIEADIEIGYINKCCIKQY